MKRASLSGLRATYNAPAWHERAAPEGLLLPRSSAVAEGDPACAISRGCLPKAPPNRGGPVKLGSVDVKKQRLKNS